MPTMIRGRLAGTDSDAPANSDETARQEAIKQIERKRRFKYQTAVAAIGMLILVAIWRRSRPARRAVRRRSPRSSAGRRP